MNFEMTTLRISDEGISCKLNVADKVYKEFVKQHLLGMVITDQIALITKISKNLKMLPKED